MELKLYNTRTRSKDPFRPLDPSNVRMYVCGPTVYDFAHIGNARPVIVFDVLFRLLRHLYGAERVAYVRNITDVDDRINARAAERGVPIRQLTEETYATFREDVAALGCLPPTVEPRATEHIAEMKVLIERLVASGHAYVAEEHVLFHVPSMRDYGQLSKQPLDEMLVGARVEVAPYKRDPLDFVLWKPSKPGEPAWPSPSGIDTPGRPGWHIECSAMAWRYLGKTFDIHGGGIDLVFPHHENEIAQSRCAFATSSMAQVWMHNGFLQVEKKKMAKSLGNFRTIADLRRDWQGEVIRYQMLTTHYRQPIDWTESSSRQAQFIVDRWYEFARNLPEFEFDTTMSGVSDLDPSVVEPLLDDVNTPEALGKLAHLFDRAKRDPSEAARFVRTVQALGFLNQEPESYFEFYRRAGDSWPSSSPEVPLEIKKIRDKARADRQFEQSDYLRNVIYLYGYRVIDRNDGESILAPADRDFTSISAPTREKLSRAVRAAMKAAKESESTIPSLGTGFLWKFGQTFNYTDDFNSALSSAYQAIENDLGIGVATEDDLKQAVIDIVLSNQVHQNQFAADIVAGAILLKFLSGVVQTYTVYLENTLISIPEGAEWTIGNVSVTDSKQALPRVLPKISGLAPEFADQMSQSKSLFSVRTPSTATTAQERALALSRAFVTATRFLTYFSDDQERIVVPPRGAVEQDVVASAQRPLSIIESTDGTLHLPSRRNPFIYRLSQKFITDAYLDPLYERLNHLLQLDLFNPIPREFLALERLTRARSAPESYGRLLWNLEAVRAFCETKDTEDASFLEVLQHSLSTKPFAASWKKQVMKEAQRLHRYRRRAGLVGPREARSAHAFGENVVLSLLVGQVDGAPFDNSSPAATASRRPKRIEGERGR